MEQIEKLRNNAKTLQTVIASAAILGLTLTLLLRGYPSLPPEMIVYELSMFAIIILFMLYVMEGFAGEYSSFHLSHKDNLFMILLSLCSACILIYPTYLFIQNFTSNNIFGLENHIWSDDAIRSYLVVGCNGIFIILTLFINALLTTVIMVKESKRPRIQ